LYLPTPHSTHDPVDSVHPALHLQSVVSSLAAGENEFAGHVWHISDMAPICVEYFPAAHAVQTVIILAPRLVEYVPATQSTQASLPITSLYLPAPHCTHDPVDSVHPALHLQSVFASLADGEAEFSGHVWHISDTAPICVEYFPATHDLQTVIILAPRLVEYVPATQSTQTPLPTTFLYLPASHFTHDPSDSVHPALHLQSVFASLADGEAEFAGHAMQTPCSIAAHSVEYVFARQG